MFDRVVHADWSMAPGGRFAAGAKRRGSVWSVDAPQPVGASEAFLDRLHCPGERVLAGFDFPIGVPLAWGERSGLRDFRELLDVIGTPPWHAFGEVCERPQDISLRRPFFPYRNHPRPTASMLVDGLGVPDMESLLRRCERPGPGRKRASALFWTMGPAQVGKAALTGWKEILRPSRHAARIWPFDGPLDRLAGTPGLVIAETYPADALPTLRISRPTTFSKGRRSERMALVPAIVERLRAGFGSRRITLTARAERALEEGFGRDPGGDAFDAFIGLLAMIATLETGPAAGASEIDACWEGAILGR